MNWRRTSVGRSNNNGGGEEKYMANFKLNHFRALTQQRRKYLVLITY